MTTDPNKRAINNQRYYAKRKYGLIEEQSFYMPEIGDQPLEVQEKIKAIQAVQQKTPKDFYKSKIKDRCEICDNKQDLQRHHIKYIPIEETITVCRVCHSLIHGRIIGSYSNNSSESLREKWARQKRNQRAKLNNSKQRSITYTPRQKYKKPDLNYIS